MTPSRPRPLQTKAKRTLDMVERRTELNRRYHRKAKMRKLKAKLAGAKDARERENILKKIHRISPWWIEPRTQPA
jgi:hypothetical protein